MIPRRALAAACALVLLAGCDSPQKAARAVEDGIREYTAAPGPALQARTEQDFARLEAQIEKLRAAGRDAEADAWQTECDNLRLRFSAALVGGQIRSVKQAAEDLGNAFRRAGESLNEALKSPPQD